MSELVRYGEAVDQAMAQSVALHLAQIETSRGLLLGTLGHDLRNPLGAVLMSAEYLLRAQALEPLQVSAVSRIVSSADTMSRLIEDLLDLTTLTVRTLPLKLTAVDFGAVCSEVVDELLAAHPGRTIHCDRDGDLRGVCDPGRLRQLLSNLAANAIQHGNASRPIGIALSGDTETVSMRIHNEGTPIASDLRATLFEPGLETDGRRSSVPGASGMGLGLYIAHEIVAAHSGTIEMSSTANKGTTFTVRLPRRPGAAPMHT